MPETSRPRVPEYQPDEAQHRRQIARGVNLMMNGWLDCTKLVTLTDSVAMTTVTDARININSAVLAMPTTANAAAEIGAGGLYFVTANGSVVIHHANNAQTDRTFMCAIVG
jgi:hypothetical protein